MAFTQLSHGLLDRDPAGLVVVEAGHGPGVGVDLVQELLGHRRTKDDIVGATAPLPCLSQGTGPVPLAPTVGQAALGAVPGDRVGHPRRENGVDKRRFPVVGGGGLKGGHGAVPGVVLELGGALPHGELGPGGDAGAELVLGDLAAGQHGVEQRPDRAVPVAAR